MHVYPVIHVQDLDQVLSQVRLAQRHDVDGIFLIDHDANDARLSACVNAVRDAQPELFVGVNFIRRSAAQALRILHEEIGHTAVDAIWADHAGVDLEGPTAALRDLTTARSEVGWTGQHFGGIAFKYQDPVPPSDLPDLARAAAQHVDVPTTSGPATGQEADLTKLQLLRQGLGSHSLALASGVRPDNAVSFMGLVDHVLVATGINDERDQIDESKLDRLLTTVRVNHPKG